MLKLLVCLALALLSMGCARSPAYTLSFTLRTDGAPKVALYSDRGVRPESLVAAHRMLSWMGLAGFDLLCVPGGNIYIYSQSLSDHGREKVRAFVDSGGAYIGICGGAYFAARKVVWCGFPLPMKPLGLFSGVARGPIWRLGGLSHRMSRLRPREAAATIGATVADENWMLYWRSPTLIADKHNPSELVLEYSEVGLPAAWAFEHGKGRVFLIGPHPEIEEDDERDGLNFAKCLADRGSDWVFMKNAVLWSLKLKDNGRSEQPEVLLNL